MAGLAVVPCRRDTRTPGAGPSRPPLAGRSGVQPTELCQAGHRERSLSPAPGTRCAWPQLLQELPWSRPWDLQSGRGSTRRPVPVAPGWSPPTAGRLGSAAACWWGGAGMGPSPRACAMGQFTAGRYWLTVAPTALPASRIQGRLGCSGVCCHGPAVSARPGAVWLRLSRLCVALLGLSSPEPSERDRGGVVRAYWKCGPRRKLRKENEAPGARRSAFHFRRNHDSYFP